MKAVLVCGAAALLALSVACIASTVAGMAAGKYGWGSWQVWAALAFHPVTGALGLWLLHVACPPRPTASQEGGAQASAGGEEGAQ